MHLIFEQKGKKRCGSILIENLKNRFKIHDPQGRVKNDTNLETILKIFSNTTTSKTGISISRQSKMDRYIELITKEEEIAKKRIQLLKELKREFKEDFLPKFEAENPEYFL